MPQTRTMAGFAAEASDGGYAVHIVDDTGEVIEIQASRDNVELMIQQLQLLLDTGRAEDAHARGAS